ncbi:unnamed protein product [Rhizoctonia solani]|uniref:Secreted protein n=1 Tax=Rhizoctonia solani TaxID=456999 RepID=A0A8H2XCS5_9AGAM|nr:unnamed protein product [Rhizoctonia solani]
MRCSLCNALLFPATWTNFTLQLHSAMEGDPALPLNQFYQTRLGIRWTRQSLHAMQSHALNPRSSTDKFISHISIFCLGTP